MKNVLSFGLALLLFFLIGYGTSFAQYIEPAPSAGQESVSGEATNNADLPEIPNTGAGGNAGVYYVALLGAGLLTLYGFKLTRK